MSLPSTPVFFFKLFVNNSIKHSTPYNWSKIVKSFYFKDRKGKEEIIWRRKTLSCKRERRTEKKKIGKYFGEGKIGSCVLKRVQSIIGECG